MDRLPFTLVLTFLLFSGIFFYNSYKLWFKTEVYYQDIHNSLTRQPSLSPFSEFLLKGMENKERGLLWQKVFSLLGLIAVIVADAVVVAAWRN